MSKRSTHRLNQRVREGENGKRRVQLHVMQTQAQKISNLLAAKLKDLIAEEVANELDRRGIRDRKVSHDVSGNEHEIRSIHGKGDGPTSTSHEREDSV
jgi:hypothetical protein